ncbi:Protein Muted-like protein [Operophtera brumata]|uniref:Biogenesis of lysosome-related organelles complex 1 subunit 5 n=1 Tax=Operophtera brumata TaxID=104452 RepID=A0A0L7L774_OPEBR|nr:Protein Muted-like protein [Operophtera brumata]
MTELSREIGEIWTRLFDHRPFLNGEIKYMLKEFEKFAEIKDIELVTVKKCGEVGLPVLKEKLDQAIKLFDEVESDYLETRKVYQKKREENKEKRQKEWDQFIDDMNFKCQRIDNAFEEKEEELRDLYADLNHKLNIADN